MRRSLLIVVLGVGFLVVMTAAATIADTIVPRRPTATLQTAQAGPYQLTLHVDPNPPSVTQATTLSFQVLHKGSQQPVMNAHITVENSMETMDMGTEQVNARGQPDGTYVAQVQFTMSGPWQVHVIVAVPGASTQSASFTVMAQ